MGFGLIGKTPRTRLITGSVEYGERTRKETYNRRFRLFPNRDRGRTVMVVAKKAIIYVDPKKKTIRSKRAAAK